MTSPLLEVEGLRIRRGGIQVCEVSYFALRPGEVLALVGANGAGKSTLLLALAGLIPAEYRSFRFQGETLRTAGDFHRYRERVTAVFQEPYLLDRSVKANLAAGLKFRGRPRQEVEIRVLEQARRFRIEHLLDRSALHLSGGEARRVSLARALALQPDVLFLDEPFASLDAASRESLLKELPGIVKDTGVAVLLISHELGDALRLADSLAILGRGQLLQQGPILQIINHPVDEDAAKLLGMECLLEGVVTSRDGELLVLEVAGHSLEATGNYSTGTRLRLGIRPENVTLHRQVEMDSWPDGQKEDHLSSARNHIPCRVAAILAQGPFVKLELDCGFDLQAYLTRHSLEKLQLQEGSRVVASFKATALHVIRG